MSVSTKSKKYLYTAKAPTAYGTNPASVPRPGTSRGGLAVDTNAGPPPGRLRPASSHVSSRGSKTPKMLGSLGRSRSERVMPETSPMASPMSRKAAEWRNRPSSRHSKGSNGSGSKKGKRGSDGSASTKATTLSGKGMKRVTTAGSGMRGRRQSWASPREAFAVTPKSKAGLLLGGKRGRASDTAAYAGGAGAGKVQTPKSSTELVQRFKAETTTSRKQELILASFRELMGGFERPSLVMPCVYIGDREDSRDRRRLMQLGVTHILNVASQLPNVHPADFIYRKLNMIDSETQDLKPFFDRAASFIDDALRAGGRVLVHCIAGVSRSVAMVVAFMMSRRGIRLQAGLKQITKARSIIRPNEGFLLALAEYEVALFGDSSVADEKADMWNFTKFNMAKGHFKKAPVKTSCVVM